MDMWNYRVLKGKQNGSDCYEIHEVYYDEDGKPRAWAESHNVLIDDGLDELKETYDYIQNAFKMPVLEEVDGKLVELK
ncbi:hypothetical protein SLU01_11870 [Sporosarcina luteola]|uniref:Uncharacterized protein n=2 Tax=Sporosarcina luteola TaxID=582850 RepID=A0A511Z613_9BACL|nr:hypothetical protein SLU01_11870 [Sporosarcina luteola]